MRLSSVISRAAKASLVCLVPFLFSRVFIVSQIQVLQDGVAENNLDPAEDVVVFGFGR